MTVQRFDNRADADRWARLRRARGLKVRLKKLSTGWYSVLDLKRRR